MKETDFQLRLLAELMKNSKASDRDLAKKLGVSQPTASRTRSRLKEEGYIKEYTIMPDFRKLGFEIMALTFVRLSSPVTKETIAKLREFADSLLAEGSLAIIMAYEGMGHEANRVIMTLHENYASYAAFLRLAKQNQVASLYNLDSFIINLASSSDYLPLTFSKLADYMLKSKK